MAEKTRRTANHNKRQYGSGRWKAFAFNRSYSIWTGCDLCWTLRKDVWRILCTFYTARFPHSVWDHRKKCMKKPKLFVVDNNPSQTSAKAKCALCHAKCKMVQIPARSPDLNPIENVFHIIWRQLEADVEQNTIITETWDEFVSRIKRNLWSIPKDYVEKTIASIPNRMNLIVKAKGHRIKY